MYLQQLTLSNFRNFEEASLEFSEKVNCFLGNNGVGKTNLLDAIYYLSFTKSYFNTADQLSIRHNESFFAIHGTFKRNGDVPDKVSCVLKSGQKKSLKINQKEYDRLSEHIGQFPCVMVSPYDRDLINEGSDVRRKFIDQVISLYDKVYLDNLIRYNRLIEQRNALLRRFAEEHRSEISLLQLIDEQIDAPLKIITGKRSEFVQDFVPVFAKYYKLIAGANEEVNIVYESNVAAGNYLETANSAFRKDLSLRYSSVGVHKDDFLFELQGYPVKKFGSQGQQKSFAVALKLAQFEYVSSIVHFKPMLLLDDIFDKLDPQRVERIISLTEDSLFGQVFITDTEPDRISRLFARTGISHKLFVIEDGAVVNPDK